jgi:hypothetical protein
LEMEGSYYQKAIQSASKSEECSSWHQSEICVLCIR